DDLANFVRDSCLWSGRDAKNVRRCSFLPNCVFESQEYPICFRNDFRFGGAQPADNLISLQFIKPYLSQCVAFLFSRIKDDARNFVNETFFCNKVVGSLQSEAEN